MKRVFDLLMVVATLPLTSVMISLCFALYFLSATRQPIFRQLRIGLNGEPFTIFKFRTLTSIPDAPLKERQFPLGNFLRSTSLDELPQLWNVLKGDMSIVGPRPLPVEYAHAFSTTQNKRHEVRPGITGLAQVSGRTSIPWPDKLALDTDYVERLSFVLDLKIIFKTLVLILTFPEDNSLDEKKFTDNA